MISLSQNEVSQALEKAARARGWPLGLGAEFASVAIANADTEWTDVLAFLEREIDGHPLIAWAAARDQGVPASGVPEWLVCATSNPSRVFMPTGTWRRIEAIAAEIYVPASDASRSDGAGAGDIDND